MIEMDLKTRMEVLPCGKCEDMLDCDNCLFQKEAKELYEQIRAEAIEEILSKQIVIVDDDGLAYSVVKVKDIKGQK